MMRSGNRTGTGRWNFICSYGGIMTAGVGIYVITMLIYILIGSIRGIYTPLQGIMRYPRLFLIYTLPIVILQTLFLLISNIALCVHEGTGLRRFIGTAAGIVMILMHIAGIMYAPAAPAVCYMECFSIGIAVMSLAAVFHRPGLDNDFMIILGCSIGEDGRLLPLIRGRVNRAIHFAWEQEIATGKPVKYIPSGGRGEDEDISEGGAMSMYLLDHSAEVFEIISEKASTNTYENFLYSRKLIEEQKPDAREVFVTTNYHVLRSGMLARKAGLNAEGLSSTARWYFWPNGYVREIAAIAVMYRWIHIAAIAACAALGLIWIIP